MKQNIYEAGNPGSDRVMISAMQVVTAPRHPGPVDACEDLPAIMQAVGARITALRKRRFDTIEAFAQAAGLNSAYAWRVEAGRQNLSLGTLCRICTALGVRLADIFLNIGSIAEPVKPDPDEVDGA